MKYGTFDIESTNWICFEVGGFFDGEKYETFLSPAQFLSKINRKVYAGFQWYAHNGGKFDFLFLMEELLRRGWVTRIIARSGRLIKIQCNTGKITFALRDSYAALPSSLEKLGKTFRVKHQKTSMDYKNISANDERTLRYLENDVLCLHEILSEYFAFDFITTPQLTIASQALNTFRTRFCTSELERWELEEEGMIRERFYAGGRVEAYKGFGKNLYGYDVNSLYPYAMLDEMPVGDLEPTKTWRRGDIGFYQIELRATPDWYVSPLLVKKDKNVFLSGPGLYDVGSPTIEILREEGVKFKIIEGWKFKKKEHLFVDYVDTFYRLKTENRETAMEYIAKLFLNSLYGKFGQSRWNETFVHRDCPSNGEISYSTSFDQYGLVLVSERSRNRFIMPYVAAYITERARVIHYRMMRELGRDVWYCDTDSFFTTRKLDTGKKIGDIKNIGRGEGVFIAPKIYALKGNAGEKVVFKGFQSKEFTFANILNLAQKKIQELTETRERILSFQECLGTVKEERIKRREGKFLVLVDSKKSASGENTKRRIVPSKKHLWDSLPFSFVTLLKE